MAGVLNEVAVYLIGILRSGRDSIIELRMQS